MSEGGDQFPTLPRAVRNNEIEQATFFTWFLLFEQPPRIPREFEKPHAFLKVRLIGGLVPFDFAQATILLGTPLSRHPIEKGAIHLPIELIDIHGVRAGLKPVVFGPQPPDCRFMLALLVGMARAERVANPGQDLVVKGQPAEQLRKLTLNDFFANIGLFATALVAAAVVVNVTLLLHLADNRTSAMAAGDQPRERKIVFHAAMLLSVPVIEDALHALPQFGRDQRLVLAQVNMTVPFELAHIEPIA